jgi:hypothetical protein
MRKMLLCTIFFIGVVGFSTLSAHEEKECEKEQRLVIRGVIPGSYAETIDIRPGDVIATYNGKEVHCLKKLTMLKEEVNTDSVEVVIHRDNEFISFTIPKGQIGVRVKELLPDIEFEKNAKIIEGIGSLDWDAGESNSFIAALTRIAEYLRIQKDYTYLMGTSAAAFRIHFHEEWCPSSPDPTVGFDCGNIAAQSINLVTKPMFLAKEGKNRDEIRQKIITSIDKPMPVMAIDLIEVAEWGLVVGYQQHGDEFIVRDYLARREGYDIAEKFPWIIMTVEKGSGEIDDTYNFKHSLEIAQELYETEKYDAYYSGTAAIEYWIKRLRKDTFGAMKDEKFNDVMLANAWIYQRLAEDRKFAAEYLKSFTNTFPTVVDEIAELIVIYETVHKLMVESESVVLYPSQITARDDWTDEMRQREIDVLTEVLEKEKEAHSLIKKINEKI